MMLDHRVTFINFLRDHGYRFGWGLELRPIHHQLTFLRWTPIQGPCRVIRCVAEMNRADRGMSGSGDAVDLNALIDDRFVIIDDVVVDDGGVVVNLGDLRAWQAAMGKIVVVEIVQRDERIMVRVQTEIEIHSNADTIKAPAETGYKLCVRWQRGPTAIVALTTPHDPCGSPDSLRYPNPSTTLVEVPAAIVERRPAPGIVRLPVPSSVGINPMAGIAIRPPGAIDYHHARLPAPADSVQLDPSAIGRKIVIKVSDIGRRTADVNRRGRRDRSRFSRGRVFRNRRSSGNRSDLWWRGAWGIKFLVV